MRLNRGIIWGVWLLIALGMAGYLGAQLFFEDHKEHFLIGQTSHGHFQIEMQCTACHTEAFGGGEVLQNACISCHAQDLKDAHDSHPISKFTDPRNADRLAVIDARQCTACHVEHNPEITHPMGLSLPQDFCFHCHQDIAQERPSHEGMGFETCASSGCHNYHDNRALYEDFLVTHAHGSWLKPGYGLLDKDMREYLEALGKVPKEKPNVKQNLNEAELSAFQEWQHSMHYDRNVGCDSCHGGEQNWQPKPAMDVCQSCHQREFEGFTKGKHGMRIAAGLPPMSPSLSILSTSNLAFHTNAMDKPLTCSTCHDPHSVDVRFAAVDSCLSCHADDHSRSFETSPHGQLWESFKAGAIAQEQAVSCASCHMPRMEVNHMGIDRILVEHNQNTTLRPNEKMIRPVCMSCHSLEFAIDALADKNLIKNNFSGQPEKHIQSIDMSLKRAQ